MNRDIFGDLFDLRRAELRQHVIVLFLVLALGTAVYRTVEPLDTLDATYLSVITLSTVGYGDVHPMSDAGKVFTAFYLLAGVVIHLSFARVALTNHHKGGDDHE